MLFSIIGLLRHNDTWGWHEFSGTGKKDQEDWMVFGEDKWIAPYLSTSFKA
jgi:hypothetical protein